MSAPPFLPVANFCADLCERTEDAVLSRHELPRMREAGAVYRADPLYEAVADLTDVLLGVEQGRLGEDVARQEALRVCRLAVLLWLSVVGEDGRDGDD